MQYDIFCGMRVAMGLVARNEFLIVEDKLNHLVYQFAELG